MLTNTIQTPLPRHRKVIRHDCGNGDFLTVQEIARRTGAPPNAIYARIEKGWSGRDLLRPKRCKFYDCGDGLKLTVRDIAERTGIKESTVYHRIIRGWRGKELLVPAQSSRKPGLPRGPVQVIACKLAIAFDRRLPTTAEIRKVHPMSPASAMRWRNAMRIALEYLS